ncbi:MAG: CheR family methyltransferase [Actinomycetota bacterium]
MSEQGRTEEELEALLRYLKESRGFDFTGYKRSSLSRRIHKRMETVGIDGAADYLDRLQVDPDEFTELFNCILINVTNFFRDPAIWDFLADEVVPRVVEARGEDQTIRLWLPGCASGEEPYSLAMLFAEQLGTGRFRERVKIYATDVDEDALAQARAAVYTARQVEDVPPVLLSRYLDRGSDGSYMVSKELRQAMIFGRHDLVQDAPISRIDLLMCRNTLMYLNSETQTHVMGNFYFALNEGGFLVLGKAEMLFTHLRSFSPVDLRRRVFMKATSDEDVRERLMLISNAYEEGGSISSHLRGRESAFELGPVAQLVVDRNGMLTQANARARKLFGLNPQDLGRPLQDLDVSFRPVELRSHIQRIQADREPIRLEDVQWQLEGETMWLEVELVPLEDRGGGLLGVSVAVHEVTSYRDLRQAFEHANQELETAMEELQSTNEELETTNEELQSTNEELETTNEELQSTNEELETTNEELRSTNEELETINEEVRRRTDEVHLANAFMTSILASVSSGVAVVDGELRVMMWNDRARDLWGFTEDEVRGQPFLDLDIGLPVGELKASLLGALGGQSQEPIELDAVTRRGQRIVCRVACSPMVDAGGGITGVILTMDPAPGQA